MVGAGSLFQQCLLFSAVFRAIDLDRVIPELGQARLDLVVRGGEPGSSPIRRPLQSSRQDRFGLPALCPLSMGKAAEESEEVKAQNEDFSKKAVRSLGGGAPSRHWSGAGI